MEAKIQEKNQRDLEKQQNVKDEETQKLIELRGREALKKEHLQKKYKEYVDKLDNAQKQHQISAYLQGADQTVSYFFNYLVF